MNAGRGGAQRKAKRTGLEACPTFEGTAPGPLRGLRVKVACQSGPMAGFEGPSARLRVNRWKERGKNKDDAEQDAGVGFVGFRRPFINVREEMGGLAAA